MSCYPPCHVPEFLLPKNLRDRTKSKCIAMNCNPNCTNIKLQRIRRQQYSKCLNPGTAEMLRCVVCQDEKKRREAAAAMTKQLCWLQNYTRRHPEIPGIFKGAYEPIRFIGYGYRDSDCFQQREIDNPCRSLKMWRKKSRKLIKELSDHYNEKTTRECEHPVENYIKMNLSQFYHPCGVNRQGAAYEPASLPREHYTRPYVGCGCSNI